MTTPKLINGELAGSFIDSSNDQILRAAMEFVTTLIVKRWRHPLQHSLSSDLDLRFIAEIMAELVSKRDLLVRILAGEKPGAWDE